MQDLQLLTNTDSSGSRGYTSSSSGTSTAFTRVGKFPPNLPGHQWIVAARTLLQPQPVPRKSGSQGKGSSARPNTRWLPQSQANSRAAPRHVPSCPGTLLILQPHGQALELSGWRGCVVFLCGCVPHPGSVTKFHSKERDVGRSSIWSRQGKAFAPLHGLFGPCWEGRSRAG